MLELKRFFKNKNTVTIIGVIGCVCIIFIGYVLQVNNAIKPVRDVPVAAMTIQPRTEITTDMISYMDVASIALSDNVYRSSGEIIGKYTNYNTLIPEGSMFYREAIVEQSALPDAALINLGKDEIPYSFPVTLESTYGNSITPDSYIDIYMKAENDEGTIMVGKLLRNVKVLTVKDSAGKAVFENSAEERVPSYLIFGLKYEMWLLLKKASYLNENNIELFPVPKGVEVAAGNGETIVSSETLQNFINSKTVPNSEIDAEEEAKNAKDEADAAKDNDDTKVKED